MKTDNPPIEPDVDPFVEALRDDLPSAADERRVRARLLAAGVVVGSAALSVQTAAALTGPGASVPAGAGTGALAAGGSALNGATSGAALTGASGAAGGLGAAGAPALIKVGLLSKVLVLPLAAKVGVATTLAVAVAATSIPLVLDRDAGTAKVANVAAPPPAARVAAPPPAARDVAPLLSPAVVPGARESGTREPEVAPSAAGDGADPTPRADTGVSSAPRVSRPSRAPRAASAHTSALSEEARLMERAMLALGEGDHVLARRSLEEHARRFPRGLLARERERAFTRLSATAPASSTSFTPTRVGP